MNIFFVALAKDSPIITVTISIAAEKNKIFSYRVWLLAFGNAANDFVRGEHCFVGEQKILKTRMSTDVSVLVIFLQKISRFTLLLLLNKASIYHEAYFQLPVL